MTPYYADDLVTLYHGDCLEIDAWLTADVLVTDPPYGIGYQSGTMRNTAKQTREYRDARRKVAADDTTAVRDAALAQWGERPRVVFGSWKVPPPFVPRYRLIWHKIGMPPGLNSAPWYTNDEEVYVDGAGFVGKITGSVYATTELRQGASGESARVGHPTPKPVGLMEQLIDKCPPGVIADPFAGSGSTLVAARNLGRRAIGVELEERYCETVARRLAQGVLL